MGSRTIAIASGKGGAGKTFLAVNLGVALTEFNQEAIVIDADLNAPKLALHLGRYDFPVTLSDALRGKVNLLNLVYFHPSGLRFIPSAISMSYITTNPKKLKNLVQQFKKILIFDCPPGFGREARSILTVSYTHLTLPTKA